MLDPAILHSFEMPVPPTRPQIVEERQWLSPTAEMAKRLAARMADEYERSVAAWIERVRGSREAVERSAKKASPDVVLSQLIRLINELEYQAEQRAILAARTEKRGKRLIKHWFSVDPSIGASYRALTNRLSAAESLAIEELLEHSLYLRALRADYDPDARGGPAFSDPAEMERYLREMIAA